MKWKIVPIQYHGEKRLAVHFEYRREVNLEIRKLDGARWSNTLKAWHIPDTELHRKLPGIETNPAPPAQERIVNLPDNTSEKIESFKRWLRSRRYSESTVKTYTEALISFLKFYSGKSLHEITNNDIILYNNNFILRNKLSASYQNQVVNAIKLFFAKVENTKLEIELIHRPKREKLLPNVLSKEEIKAILNAHGNIKHRAMLSLIYSCGLRRSELINLKPTDIDSKRGVILIRQSKGRKDRIAPLSVKIIQMLREYYKIYKPVVWLFAGQRRAEQYDERSLASVLKQALAKTTIKKPVSLHWLRHSYATHLLEAGTDLRYIQEILGHSSSRTTEIYTHVSTKSIQQIKSPFDDLDT
jgi:integrase/recombinase XerD